MPSINERIKQALNVQNDKEFDTFMLNLKNKLERQFKSSDIVFIGSDSKERIVIYRGTSDSDIKLHSIIHSKKYANILILYFKLIGIEEIPDLMLPTQLANKVGIYFFNISKKDLDLIKFE